MSRHLQVTGSGQAVAAPDVLVLDAGVSVRAEDVGTAMRRAGEAAAALGDAARARGLGDADLRTTSTHVGTALDRDQRPVGYDAGQGIRLRVTDTDGVSTLIAALAEAAGDAFELRGIGWELADDSALRERAREAAYADARAKAEQLAGLAGATLGKVLRLTEREDFGRPRMAMIAAGAAKAADSFPVEAGEQQVTVTLDVRWELASRG